jgi:hypothetical protein
MTTWTRMMSRWSGEGRMLVGGGDSWNAGGSILTSVLIPQGSRVRVLGGEVRGTILVQLGRTTRAAVPTNTIGGLEQEPWHDSTRPGPGRTHLAVIVRLPEDLTERGQSLLSVGQLVRVTDWHLRNRECQLESPVTWLPFDCLEGVVEEGSLSARVEANRRLLVDSVTEPTWDEMHRGHPTDLELPRDREESMSGSVDMPVIGELRGFIGEQQVRVLTRGVNRCLVQNDKKRWWERTSRIVLSTEPKPEPARSRWERLDDED